MRSLADSDALAPIVCESTRIDFCERKRWIFRGGALRASRRLAYRRELALPDLAGEKATAIGSPVFQGMQRLCELAHFADGSQSRPRAAMCGQCRRAASSDDREEGRVRSVHTAIPEEAWGCVRTRFETCRSFCSDRRRRVDLDDMNSVMSGGKSAYHAGAGIVDDEGDSLITSVGPRCPRRRRRSAGWRGCGSRVAPATVIGRLVAGSRYFSPSSSAVCLHEHDYDETTA